MKKRIILGAVAIGAAMLAFTGPAAVAGTAIGPYRTYGECWNHWVQAHYVPEGPCYQGRDGMWYYTD